MESEESIVYKQEIGLIQQIYVSLLDSGSPKNAGPDPMLIEVNGNLFIDFCGLWLRPTVF